MFQISGSSYEVGRDVEGDNERNSARMILFQKLNRNSNSFRQAARGVEVRERLATLSSRYPSSSADVHEGSQLSCIHLSLQRTGSNANAGATGDQFYNSEVFKYGSQRHGASGSSLNTSLGRLGSLNEREVHERGEEEGASSSSMHWTTLDLNGVPSTLKPRAAAMNSDTTDAIAGTFDTRVLLGKPRSGPLAGKQMSAAHRKSGSTWEQRVRMERESFRGLRSSFSLHRSASEGRAEMIEIELPLSSHPAVEIENGTSLAQRTMQWLAGGAKHARLSPARGSLEGRNTALQQVVTE